MSIPFLRSLTSLACGGLFASAAACGSSADAPPGDNGGAGNTATATGGAGATGAMGGAPGGGAGAAPPVGGSGATAVTGGAGGTPTGGAGGTPTGGTGGSGGVKVFDAGSAPDRNRVQPGAVCGRFATIQCAGEAYCCESPGRNFDQCYQAQLDACVNEVFLDAISQNPVTGYNVDKAEIAFAEFERLASQCDPTIAQWASSSTGLRTVTDGTIAPGASCAPPAVPPPDIPTSAAYAASCTNGDTTACLPTLTAWTCAPRAAAGGDCFTDLNCMDGLFCDNPDLSLSGDTCQARKADGQPCGLPNECASLTCRNGSCVPATVQTAYCLAEQ